jgi:hypothetical protein
MNTGPWKCRTVDAEENQKQVSLCAPSAWKSQKARFPHSHGPGEPVEKWKSKSRISTFPSRLFVLSQKKERRFP